MSTISVQDVQRAPRAFLDRVEAGEPLLLVRDSVPVAEISPVSRMLSQPRPYGLCAGEFAVPADFDHPLADGVLSEFES